MSGRHVNRGKSRPSATGFTGLKPVPPVVGLAGAVLLVCAWPLLADTPQRPRQAAVVPIRGEITDVLKDSLQRRVELALADGAKTVIFEIDTPGGLVTSALDICRLIKNLPDDVHSVAWVNPFAYSAGAMISLSCKEVVMSGRSSIGDCAPIMISPVGGLEELPTAERAKAESPVLEEFRDSAVRNGYDPLICRAMVTVGEEVWWIEPAADEDRESQRRFVNAAEKARLIDEVEEDQAQWRLVETYVDPVSGKDVPAKNPVDSAEELLTLHQNEAVAYGIASGIASNLDVVVEHLGLSRAPAYYESTGWEKFIAWLNSPAVRGILFIIMLMGAYIEFQSPGLILPGVTAGVALLIFLAAPYAAGLADAWTFVLLGLGVVLLLLEIFVIPGFGIAGFLGIVLILIAFIGTFVPSEPAPDPANPPFFQWPELQGTWDDLKIGIIVLSSSVIIAVMGILLIVRYLPQLSLSRRLIPVNPRGAAMALGDAHPDAALVGEIGIVTGDLRPGGQARFGQEIVDVQSQGEYVEAGRRVQVLRRKGMNIIVRPLPEDSAT